MNDLRHNLIRMQQAPLIVCCLFLLLMTQNIHCFDGTPDETLSDHTSLGGENIPHDTSDPNPDSPGGASNYDQINPGSDGSGLDNSPDANESNNNYRPPNELEFVRLNDTSLVLKWDLPLHLSHLQFFKIQYKSSKKDASWKTENHEIPPTVRAYQINGLRPGNYFFIVTAVYDNDDNVASEQVKFKLRARSKINATEMPEMTPPLIFWSEGQVDYIRFKWKYQPKTVDIPYYGYLVYYRSAHSVTDFTIHNTLDESVELAELEPDTPYEAKVVAYNQHGVSRFSDTIRIRTTSVNTTSTPASIMTTTVSAITTRKPSIVVTESPIHQVSTSTNDLSPSSTTSFPRPSIVSTTSKPTIVPQTPPTINNTKYTSISSVIDLIFGARANDTTQAIKYSLIVLLPVVFIVSTIICLISCCHRQRKESPPSPTHDSIQFDLEINGYFKNSFPGVQSEYPSLAKHHAHHGFVNNHPHINDFA